MSICAATFVSFACGNPETIVVAIVGCVASRVSRPARRSPDDFTGVPVNREIVKRAVESPVNAPREVLTTEHCLAAINTIAYQRGQHGSAYAERTLGGKSRLCAKVYGARRPCKWGRSLNLHDYCRPWRIIRWNMSLRRKSPGSLPGAIKVNRISRVR